MTNLALFQGNQDSWILLPVCLGPLRLSPQQSHLTYDLDCLTEDSVW